MFELVPLQVFDSLILPYHFGHVFALLLVLSVIGVLPTGSNRALSLNLGVFGLLFLLTPYDMLGEQVAYKLLGLVLLVVAPLLFSLSDE